MNRVLVLLAALAAPAAAQTPPFPAPREAAPAEAVSVTGTARVSLAPDRAVFTAGVQTTAPTAAQATEENSRTMAAVIGALKKAGAAEGELRTSHVSVYPQMDHQPGKRPRILGYQVSNGVTVTRKTTADVSALLQAALDAGANQVSGVSFEVSDAAPGRQDGLTRAFADARAKAQVLAQAAGRTLGRALSITEGTAMAPPRPMMRTMAMEAAPDVPIEAGTEELRYTVSVTFELR
ncbi:MAG TPA: SIMPL domain-containing protein [Vicinamibacteria bacterium]|jgi:uncharacterized protein YggE